MTTLSPRKNNQNQNNIFIQAAIIGLGIVGGYLYYSQLIEPNKQAIVVNEISHQDILTKFKDAKSFNFEIFNKDYFKALKILGEAPVLPGSTGRNNIFAPF